MQSSSRLAAMLAVVLATLPTSGILSQQKQETSPDKLSRPFVQAATSALVQIHRWKETSRSDAKSSLPAGKLGQYRKVEAYETLRQAQLSATTEGDQQAADALQQHFTAVNQWSDKLIRARENMSAGNSMNPDAVDEDEDLIKINDCEKALREMLQSGTYAYVGACG